MRIVLVVALFLSICGLVSKAVAVDRDEHRIGANVFFDFVMTNCGFLAGDEFRFILDDDRVVVLPRLLFDDEDMGSFSSRLAADDEALSRYHIKGWSVFNQLRLLSEEELGNAWRVHESGEVRLAELSDHNVVANYVIHHYISLRLAQQAGEAESEEKLRRALAYEAMAIGYLLDAFSSGHMLVPLTDRWQFMHSTNNRKTHDAFSNDGVYMMNSKGEAWLGFGDQVASWYTPTARHMREAGRSSYTELALVFLAAGGGDLPDGISEWTYENVGFDWQETVLEWTVLQDGVLYYNDGVWPTLSLIPMPISATWSVRTGSHGGELAGERFHYPQLADSGYHDPTLEKTEKKVLYRRADMPRWLVLSQLRRSTAEELIRDDPDVASVRFIQRRSYKPAFAGFMGSAAFGWASNQQGDGKIAAVGAGFGLLDDFAVIRKVSLNFDFYPGYDDTDRYLASPSLQLALALPFHIPYEIIKNGRFEFGWAWGVKEPFTSNGFRFGYGLEPATIPLVFTNAGVTVRVKYQWMFLEATKAGLQIELVLH